MPRQLVFGNGTLLLSVDAEYNIRDLFYPTLGVPNHLNGHRIRTGVWVNGVFSWLSDTSWTRELRYLDGTLVGSSILENQHHGVRLHIEEHVAPELPVYTRRINVQNLTNSPLHVRFFFSQDLRIAESDVGDTVLFHPLLDGIIHYKANRWFLFGGSSRLGMMDQYSIGIKGVGGMEGTWKDAEDGELAMTAIEQGSVDSTFRVSMEIAPAGEEHCRYWMVCGESLDDITNTYKVVLEDGQDQLLATSQDYWQNWCGDAGCDEALIAKHLFELARRSLLLIRTHMDHDGAVLAASDTDIMISNRSHYGYVWPRDGALIAAVTAEAGHRDLALKFFDYCTRILPKDRPAFYQKYNADGTLGASWHPWIVDGKPDAPIQEDETALVVWSACALMKSESEEIRRTMFDSLIAPASDFLVQFRDPATQLPLPSYDLWEERRGIHTFTVATVVAALDGAADIAAELQDNRAEVYRLAAAELAAAMIDHLYDDERDCFHRGLTSSGVQDPTPDASLLLIPLIGALPFEDPRVRTTVKAVEKELWVQSKVGGIARYPGDWYWRQSETYTGNPWIITTMWLAQYYIGCAKTLPDLARPLELLEWAALHAKKSGVLAEQLNAESGAPLSVSPLIWSHAEYLKTVQDYCRKWKELEA